MLTAAEIAELIKQCATHHVLKFETGPKGEVSLTFSGYREPAQMALDAVQHALNPPGDPWLDQHIPPPPLPPEVA